MDNPRLPYLREKAAKLPDLPGVYIMRDKKGEIIYIGKAKELINRVSSYFRAVDSHTPKVYQTVENINDFDYIVTTSEFEALVLECSMIKLHKPKYNILLKDDKGYNYIRIGRDAYPRITAELSRNDDDNAEYLGPYMSSFTTRETVEALHQIFKLPTCRREFPRDFGKERPCLYFHINRCMGTCRGRTSEAEYASIIAEAREFLNTGSHDATKRMQEEMQEAAERLDFEKAATLRDRLKSIAKITAQQNVVYVKAGSQDALALVQNGSRCSAVVLKVRKERLIDKLDFQLGEVDNLPAARREFLLSYYNNQTDIPRVISVDGPCEDQELLSEYLTKKAGRSVVVHTPERGDRLRLVEMARQNAAETLSLSMERTGRELGALDELARLLGLENPPTYIEAYDISNLGEDTIVGGMIVFENGRPQKSAYRKFNIETTDGIDDYGSMREMVSRRLARYESEKHTEHGFGRLPDLILLDGGKGHVNAVTPILCDMGFAAIPLYGLVKDRSHRTRAIATDGGEISIQSTRSAFTLLSKIQDEVHRFSISHMKTRHKKTTFTSQLEEIPGMGPARIRAVLKHFRTQKAIREATIEELAAVKGMTLPTAEKVHDFYRTSAATEPTE